MLNKLVKIICDLEVAPFFYVDQGLLKEKFLSHYLKEEGVSSDIFDFNLQASIQICREYGQHRPTFQCQLEYDAFVYCVEFNIDDFDNNEIEELTEYLAEYPKRKHQKNQQQKKTILRRNIKENLLNISEAAKILVIPQKTLKTLIPCSDVCVLDNETGKSLGGFYWENELIYRLRDLRELNHGTDALKKEDVSFICEHCCDGYLSWAHDVIRNFLDYQSVTRT